MALREQFVPDLANVFINTGEFATTREFRVNDGRGGFKVFLGKVVWDTEAVKQLPLVKIHGVYLGDVICYMPHSYLTRPPVAGELIYSPAHTPWEVLDVTDEEGCYKIALTGTRSQPGAYGRN
jgi:hypothetical protein